MRVSTPMKAITLTFFFLVLGWVWYSIAADYGYSAVSGTYSLQAKGEASTLILKQDGTFKQELKREGTMQHAQGSWRRFGEGGIVFSKEFLNIPGQETRPDGQVYGNVKKDFGLFLSIALNPESNGPVFRKRLFR